jgi:hypothetical protein
MPETELGDAVLSLVPGKVTTGQLIKIVGLPGIRGRQVACDILSFLQSHRRREDIQISLMGLSIEQYERLKNASARFLSEDAFGHPQIEDAMIAIFGSERNSREAQAWKAYWTALADAEEKKSAGDKYSLPHVRDCTLPH